MLFPLETGECREVPYSIYLLGWGKYLFIHFLSFPFSSHDDCTSSYDLMLEIYLLILGIIDDLGATITLLMVSQGKYSLQHLALHRLAGFRRVAPSIRAFYKIVEQCWVLVVFGLYSAHNKTHN